MAPSENKLKEAIKWPSYWLVVLERAVSTGDYNQAAHAQRQLLALGVDVTMRIVPQRKAVATC
ncbi:hypothetical protein VT84_05075 [Gemmata sp. SH-PL17]|uniref:hypothetical protein n=1 Tax=Gemmata sp. SH-PL17 TaxID=1630693 RepID=UPI0004B890A0|nr:hypothetical protein [Gemmata sp. SH-PL17]AMV23762.1 hypothetical protein VT84_05075 [Gemmata sp. SH-PL17]